MRNLPRNKTKALAKHGDRSNAMNFSNRKEKLLKEFHEEMSKGWQGLSSARNPDRVPSTLLEDVVWLFHNSYNEDLRKHPSVQSALGNIPIVQKNQPKSLKRFQKVEDSNVVESRARRLPTREKPHNQQSDSYRVFSQNMENTAKSTNEESGYGQPKKKKRKERQVALKQSQTNVLGINHDKSADEISKSLHVKKQR